jgi:hypothetical protein
MYKASWKEFGLVTWTIDANHVKMSFIMIFLKLPSTFSWSIGTTNIVFGFWRRELLGIRRWKLDNLRILS